MRDVNANRLVAVDLDSDSVQPELHLVGDESSLGVSDRFKLDILRISGKGTLELIEPSPITAAELHDPQEETEGNDTTQPRKTDTRTGQRYSGYYWGPEEDSLYFDFEGLAEKINLEDVARLQPGRKLPKNIKDYDLISIVNKGTPIHSSTFSGNYIKLPEGVTTNYRPENSIPYVDTSYAIGLVYRGILTALAAAHTGVNGQLNIMQIQAVDSRASKPEKKFETGLHGGFYWRDTLVQAWIQIAQELEIGVVEIQAARNSRWMNTEKAEQLSAGYDEVAQRMGFEKSRFSGNWTINVSSSDSDNAIEDSVSES